MPEAPRPVSRLQRHAVLLCLVLQACILVPSLNLLPVWGDEHFTLQAAPRSLHGVWQTYANDKVNPPLHGLLVHFWLLLPWPVSKVVAARALSVLFALLATVAADRLLAKGLEPGARLAFLLLWATSPCVLLFGRMARAYSLQVLLFLLALGAALELLKNRRSTWSVLKFAAWETCLLYTHYVPGLALLGGLVMVSAWRAIRDREAGWIAPVLTAAAVTGVLYVPWLPHLWVSLQRLAYAGAEVGAGARVFGVGAGLSYWFFSFCFGETPPLWVLAGAVFLTPGILYLLWRGAQRPPQWLWLLAPVTLAAYIGAGRWVAFPFLPARLLFLLPGFLALMARGIERSGRTGWVVCGAWLVLAMGSTSSYFRKTDFLNKGYLLPYDEIAEVIQRGSSGQRVVVVADTCNLDPSPLLSQMGDRAAVTLVGKESTLRGLEDQIEKEPGRTVWYFRSTHDNCPGGLNGQLEAELALGREVQRHLYVPYAERDKFLMKVLGWQEQPTHYVELLELRRK
jgi:uncharacterized membrane protein